MRVGNYVGFAYGVPLVVAMAVILGTSWNEPCDQPLKYWILAVLIVQAAILPFRIVLTLNLPDVSEGQDQEAAYARMEAVTSSWQYQVTRCIKCLAFVCFVAGTFLTFKCTTCKQTASTLYTLSLGLVVLFLVLVGVFSLYCCLYLCCLLGSRLRRLPNQPARPTDRVPNRMAASPEAISALKKLNFTASAFLAMSHSLASQNTTCAICLSDFEDNEELRLLPCRHVFHAACIDTWLRTSKLCPLCQRPIDKAGPPPAPSHTRSDSDSASPSAPRRATVAASSPSSPEPASSPLLSSV